MIARMPRLATCSCGECKKCKKRIYMLEWSRKNLQVDCACGGCIACRRNRYEKAYYESRSTAPKKRRYTGTPDERRKQAKAAYRAKESNKIKEREYQKQYLARPEARAKRRETVNKYNNERYRTDINHRLRVILRTRLNRAIRDNAKAGSAVRDLGCSIDELKKHLESKFTEGMTWDNWGLYSDAAKTWHIDHIKPLAAFNLDDRASFLEAANYQNLQPMWAEDNIVKSDSSIFFLSFDCK